MPNNFNITDLDFDSIKFSLKKYLSSQSTLKDYNFEGSVLNTIIDVLAYNTHYTSFYSNMVANEMFLDSSVLRKSVVSHAKSIGYVPTSARCSKALLTLTTTVPDAVMSRGAQFTGQKKDQSGFARFVCLKTIIAENLVFKDVEVSEGILRQSTFVYNANKRSSSIFVIPSEKIDTTTIKVRVQTSSTDTDGILDIWSEADSYMNLSPTSSVYFLQECDGGQYEIYFGDNRFGKKLQQGNVVFVEYLETNGEEGNGIESFSTNIPGITDIVAIASSGGSSSESISSIRFLAPKQYTSQNRAVTEDDYFVLLSKKYPNIDSLRVYGGDSIFPPEYGKIFFAIKPKNALVLSSLEKSTIVSDIKNNNSIITINPIVIDPEYVNIKINGSLEFDPLLISTDSNIMKAFVYSYIRQWSLLNLESFGTNLYFSSFITDISRLHRSILGIDIKFTLSKKIDLQNFKSKGFFVDFKNKLKKTKDGGIRSSLFSHTDKVGRLYTNVSIMDNGYGVLNIVKSNDLNYDIVVSSIGNVDYENGVCSFSTKFSPKDFDIFILNAEPLNMDIITKHNTILTIASQDINIELKSNIR